MGRPTDSDIGRHLFTSFLVRHQDDLSSLAGRLTGCPLYSTHGLGHIEAHERGECRGPDCRAVVEDLRRLVKPVSLVRKSLWLAWDAVVLSVPGGPGARLLVRVRPTHAVRALIDADLIEEAENRGLRVPLWLALHGATKDNVLTAVDEAWPALREAIKARGGDVLRPRSRQGLVQRPERDFALYLSHQGGKTATQVCDEWEATTDRWLAGDVTTRDMHDPAYREWRTRWGDSPTAKAHEVLDEATVRDTWARVERYLRAM
jgi:hypothetical protein